MSGKKRIIAIYLIFSRNVARFCCPFSLTVPQDSLLGHKYVNPRDVGYDYTIPNSCFAGRKTLSDRASKDKRERGFRRGSVTERSCPASILKTGSSYIRQLTQCVQEFILNRIPIQVDMKSHSVLCTHRLEFPQPCPDYPSCTQEGEPVYNQNLLEINYQLSSL